ncbi:hypothetical protein LTR05_006208 [Lithohypha guttulata]|uniref:Uncharacterized protein n=1 Tax=Lithohypha guttulata TaxID=1690604 RepID=A0AAN7YET4_9EURO|nr:hypothetical protein LTR05_006208 [Lithohypha guttulata]
MTHPTQHKEFIAVSVDEVYQVDVSRTHQGSTDPVALRLPFLISLNILLVGLCISIAVLWHFSDALDGFNVGNVNHYILTYGPTAMLVWIVAAWRQIDFHTKRTAPWRALSEGPVLAKKSILLDYISSFQAAAFWTSVQNRHACVVFSILGFVLLKITTLSSTGLLELEHTPFQQLMNLTSETVIGVDRDLSNITLTSDDPSLVYTTYGILAQNLPKPLGLGEGFTYPTFSLSNGLPTNASITLQLEAFVPSYQCQQASISAVLPASNSTDPFPETLIELSSPACTFRPQNVAISSRNPRLYRCPERQLSGFVRQIECNSSVTSPSASVYHLIVMADMRYTQELNDTEAHVVLSERVNPSSWSTGIAAMSGLVCRLNYSLQPIEASFRVTNISQSLTYRTTTATDSMGLGNFNDAILGRLFTNALIDSDGLFGSRENGNYALEYPDPMLKLMALVAGGGYERLLNATTMSEAAAMVATQIAAQIGHQYLRTNASTSLPAILHTYTTRLRVNAISAWAMCAMLAAVVLVCGGLIVPKFKSPPISVVNHPVDAMMMLSSNPPLVSDILALRRSTEAQLQEALLNTNVDLVQDWSGSRRMTLHNPAKLPLRIDGVQPWWHPITVSKPILAITFLLTVLIIAVLEILQRISDRAQGFADISGQSSGWETIYLHFLPALVVLSVATMFNCVEFNVLLLSPFHRMRTASTFKESSQRLLVSQSPLFALWSSLRAGHCAAFASSSAALVSSLLTVVVSGLYNVQTISLAASLNVQPRNSFYPVWNDSATQDNGAALIATLTENLGFADPAGTHDELAFQNMQFVNTTGTNGALDTEVVKNSTLFGILPSRRADLECVTLPTTNFSSTVIQSRIVNTLRVNATYGLPSDCLFGGENGTETVIKFAYTFPFSTTINSSLFGKLLDLHVGPYDPIMGSSAGEAEPSAMNDNPIGCPSLAFVYGFTNLTDPLNITGQSQIAVEVCYQRLQKVNATFNFLNSDFEVDLAVPPLVDESTVQYVKMSNGTLSYVKDMDFSTSFQFRIQEHFDTAFVLFNSTNENPFSADKFSPVVDRFFQGSLFGRTPLPMETMKLGSEADRKDMKQAILSFYRRYMAQAMSLNFRTTLNLSDIEPENSDSDILSIMVHSARTVRRVVQHNSSKLVLQAMLGFMFICGMISLSTIRMQELLPDSANPCTIWGQLSLWAGSEWCRQKDGNQLYDTIREQEQHVQLRLGWWSLPDGTQRYGVDIVSDESLDAKFS